MDGSWKDDVAYYNAETGNISYISSKRYTKKEILKINNEVYDKLQMSGLSIYLNYYENIKNYVLNCN